MSSFSYVDLYQGQEVLGRYRVVRCLGRGSMGSVYECQLIRNPMRKIALKVLNPKASRDEKILAAFKNEIHSSYKVSHPNVVRCHEFFRDESFYAITMEYVSGYDLWKLMQKKGSLPMSTAIDIIAQLCRGLSAIHHAGIIHQDLKPQNILVSNEGVVKITDFTAAQNGFLPPENTTPSGVFGTMEFLSPETLLYGQTDQRSDIYAIGILSYFIITGVLPFSCDDLMSQFKSKIYGKPTLPSKLNKDCPYALNKIILKALRKDPEWRYQTADELLEDLSNMDLNTKPGIFETILSMAGLQPCH